MHFYVRGRNLVNEDSDDSLTDSGGADEIGRLLFSFFPKSFQQAAINVFNAFMLFVSSVMSVSFSCLSN